MKIVSMRPPRIGMTLTAAAVQIHWFFDLSERMRFPLPITGIVAGALGFVLTIWSWWLFRSRDLAICPLAKTRQIVSDGPYRFSRNPMYLGMVWMLLGVAAVMGTLPFYFSAIIFFAVLNWVFIPYEEQKLSDAFEDTYKAYSRRVRRWI